MTVLFPVLASCTSCAAALNVALHLFINVPFVKHVIKRAFPSGTTAVLGDANGAHARMTDVQTTEQMTFEQIVRCAVVSTNTLIGGVLFFFGYAPVAYPTAMLDALVSWLECVACVAALAGAYECFAAARRVLGGGSLWRDEVLFGLEYRRTEQPTGDGSEAVVTVQKASSVVSYTVVFALLGTIVFTLWTLAANARPIVVFLCYVVVATGTHRTLPAALYNIWIAFRDARHGRATPADAPTVQTTAEGAAVAVAGAAE